MERLKVQRINPDAEYVNGRLEQATNWEHIIYIMAELDLAGLVNQHLPKNPDANNNVISQKPVK